METDERQGGSQAEHQQVVTTNNTENVSSFATGGGQALDVVSPSIHDTAAGRLQATREEEPSYVRVLPWTPSETGYTNHALTRQRSNAGGEGGELFHESSGTPSIARNMQAPSLSHPLSVSLGSPVDGIQLNGTSLNEGSETRESHRLPTELNTKRYGSFLKVSPTKRVVTYVGTGRHNNDVGSIQADRPVPTSQLMYYFELLVLDAGRSGCIAIGFTDVSAKLSRQPGWEANSYGYHGDDGNKFHSCGKGEPYGPTFTAGDIVGAGVHLTKGEIFFTKNGKSLGVAFQQICRLSLYPTIGLHSKGEKVKVNFGDFPFKFDMREVLRQEKRNMESEYKKMDLDIMDCHIMVRNYLFHYGYLKTLHYFDKVDNRIEAGEGNFDGDMVTIDEAGVKERAAYFEECHDEASTSTSASINATNILSQLRSFIMAGETTRAFDMIKDNIPSLATDSHSDVYFALKLQEFVEALREGDAQRGVIIARNELAPLRGVDPAKDAAMDQAFTLFAFSDPHEGSPAEIKALLTSKTRDKVADVVVVGVRAKLKEIQSQLENEKDVIKGKTFENGKRCEYEKSTCKRRTNESTNVEPPETECLQQLLTHLCVVLAEIRDCNGQQGELFDIETFVNY